MIFYSEQERDNAIEQKFERIPIAGCWIWTGSGTRYGAIRVNNKTLTAHRFLYERWVGPIPEGLEVLHSCDVGMCVNPAHLFLGTQGDNVTDMLLKGRHASQNMTTCSKGHAWISENIFMNAQGRTTCRICFLQYQKDYNRNRR